MTKILNNLLVVLLNQSFLLTAVFFPADVSSVGCRSAWRWECGQTRRAWRPPARRVAPAASPPPASGSASRPRPPPTTRRRCCRGAASSFRRISTRPLLTPSWSSLLHRTRISALLKALPVSVVHCNPFRHNHCFTFGTCTTVVSVQ
jgi:hypothetical protein